MAETFRGAIMAVDAGEMEAAKAYGMSLRWRLDASLCLR
ncbi:arginine/ornithine ABC transporter [Vibrio ishigakensis]|uniref:Arginine/ornithine ABC transporter n=1 Tax=Vibrio ishigakensis TaxID=1481914 RepID=A0A0B8QCX0_9VIBR|nr:arginine/ornithine ABC transporter [Vibrio ishigakensis]